MTTSSLAAARARTFSRLADLPLTVDSSLLHPEAPTDVAPLDFDQIGNEPARTPLPPTPSSLGFGWAA